MERTFNCEECNKQITLEENPRFPRKYCIVCSAKKKADFNKGWTGEKGDDKPEVTTPGYPKMIGAEKPKDNGYHLTPEQCRSNALASAIEFGKAENYTDLKEQTKIFEKYIVTGE